MLDHRNESLTFVSNFKGIGNTSSEPAGINAHGVHQITNNSKVLEVLNSPTSIGRIKVKNSTEILDKDLYDKAGYHEKNVIKREKLLVENIEISKAKSSIAKKESIVGTNKNKDSKEIQLTHKDSTIDALSIKTTKKTPSENIEVNDAFDTNLYIRQTN